MSYIAIRCFLDKTIVPPSITRKWTLKERLSGFADVFPLMSLIIIILGGIYLGFTTPTEAAAVGTSFSILISVVTKSFNLKVTMDCFKSAVRTTSMVLLIVISAQILSYMFTYTGLSRALSNGVLEMNLPASAFLLLMIVLYIILGCLLDGLSMIFVTLPLLYPIVLAFGFNPIWFGIVLVILIELGQITPPMGINLYVIQGITGRPISEVLKGCIPFFFIILLGLAIVVLFPQTALWLPSLMK